MTMAELFNSFILLPVLVLCYTHDTAQGFLFPGATFHRCTTPGKERGNCMKVLDCVPIENYIRQLKLNKVSNIEIKKLLLPYVCEQTGTSTPKICCPPSSISLPEVSLNSVRPQNSIESRLKLLPLDDCGTITNIDTIGVKYLVVNGVNASLYEFPWMAALLYKSNNGPEFQCGGTLINKRYVLTAAHCLKPAHKHKQRELVRIRLGEHNFDTEKDCVVNSGSEICAPPVQDFDVSMEDAILHPKYNPRTLDDDIALIRLRRDVDLSVVSVKPICLPATKVSRRTTFKTVLTVSGWGVTENGTHSQYLLKADAPAVDNDKCSELYKGAIQITQNQLCAGGRHSENICNGDSGGPLMQQVRIEGVLRTVQYGIVSAGPSQCELEDFPARFTRVTSYTDWILENIRP